MAFHRSRAAGRCLTALQRSENTTKRCREAALRALTVHSSGGPAPTPAALRGLQEVVGRVTARAVLDDNGMLHLEPTADSVHGRLLALLLQVRDAQADGALGPSRQWAFYDRSRNHGGTWCSMAGCGNKRKNRDHRARRRAD